MVGSSADYFGLYSIYERFLCLSYLDNVTLINQYKKVA